MHDQVPPEPAPEAAHAGIPPPASEPPTAGEWAIGVLFVLAALGLVAWIGWAIWTL